MALPKDIRKNLSVYAHFVPVAAAVLLTVCGDTGMLAH